MATKRWTGDAVAVAEAQTIAVTGVWATSDTATVTINGKDLTVTLGSSTTTSDVAAAIVAMWNGAAVVDDETRSETGDNVPEFNEITVTSSGSTITATHDTKGVPFTVSVSESTASTGALGSPSTATAATGPHHYDNADNWDIGAVPGAGDDVVFDTGNVDCKYGLSNAGATLLSVTVAQGFTGNIGLPERNSEDLGASYFEYRDTSLAVDVTTLTIGSGEGTGSGRIKIDSGSVQSTVNLQGSGQQAETGIPSVLWKGTHASNVVNVSRGNLGIAYFGGESATVATLRVGFLDNPAGDSTVICGSGTTLTTIEQSGGSLQTESAATTLTQTDGKSTLLEGAHTTLDIDGGSCFYRSTGTITTLRVGGGGLADFGRDMRARTVTNSELHAGGTLLDPFKTVTWTNGVDLNRTTLDEVSLDLGTHLTVTPSAI